MTDWKDFGKVQMVPTDKFESMSREDLLSIVKMWMNVLEPRLTREYLLSLKRFLETKATPEECMHMSQWFLRRSFDAIDRELQRVTTFTKEKGNEDWKS